MTFVAKPSFEMTTQFNHSIAMRDGTVLRGDLYLPRNKGQYPTILMRTIFRKERMSRHFGAYDPSYYVSKGYAVYIQDVRGLGESQGEFERFEADGKDGYDTIEALATAPFSDGHIGMFGNYYAGYLQLMAAAEKPPHLKAICPFQTHVTLNRDNNNRGFLFASHIGWCMAREVNRLEDGRYSKAITEKCLPLLKEYMRIYPQLLQMRPLSKMPMLELTELPLMKAYRDCLLFGYDDLDVIHREGRDMDLTQLTVPAFYLSSWYEGARNSMIEQCSIQRTLGHGDARQTQVVIGPWKDGHMLSDADGALDIPRKGMCVEAEMCHWFDRFLKHLPNETKAPYRIYNVAADGWVALDEWREMGQGQATYYLSSVGGDKRLQLDVPAQATCEAYTYDPDNPAPMMGIGMDGAQLIGRQDVLTYLSMPLEDAINVCGLVRVKLAITSSCVDTDFMAYVMDVDEAGKAMCISDGAIRAKYRASWSPSLLTPDQDYYLDIPAGHTVYTFLQGHRIRLDITSSCALRYDANHNNGERPETDSGCLVAVNKVLHRANNPSCLILPIQEGVVASGAD